MVFTPVKRHSFESTITKILHQLRNYAGFGTGFRPKNNLNYLTRDTLSAGLHGPGPVKAYTRGEARLGTRVFAFAVVLVWVSGSACARAPSTLIFLGNLFETWYGNNEYAPAGGLLFPSC